MEKQLENANTLQPSPPLAHSAEPKPRKKIGRPSKKNNIDLGMVERMASLGLRDTDIAKVLGICEASLKNYKSDPAFLAAIKKGKEDPDRKVEASLFQRACGYSCPEDVVLSFQGKHTDTVRIEKHYPPDTAAAFIWLKNRRPREWRDRTDVNIGGQDDNPLKVEVDYKGMAVDEIAKFILAKLKE